MKDKAFDLLVIGELNPDLILSGNVRPDFGQVEKLVEQATLTIGSSAAIFACGAARLGLKVVFVGKVGQDEFGRFMIQALAERGIDTSGIIIDPQCATGLSVILVEGHDRAILTYPGAIPTLTLSDIQAVNRRQAIFSNARHLHLTSYFLQAALRPGVRQLFEMAHQHGLTTSLDTNYDPSETWNHGLEEVLSITDIFLPNALECCAIAKTQDLVIARQYLASMAGQVVVKLGKDGAMLQAGFQVLRTTAISVEVVDTVGAGDTFDAGYLFGVLSGWDLQRCLECAVICGGLSTRAAGGTAAQPTLPEVLSYLAG